MTSEAAKRLAQPRVAFEACGNKPTEPGRWSKARVQRREWLQDCHRSAADCNNRLWWETDSLSLRWFTGVQPLQRTKLMRRLKDLPNQERLLRHVATRESAALCYTMMYYNILIYSNIPSSLQGEPQTLLWEVQAASSASWYRLCCASRCLFWSPKAHLKQSPHCKPGPWCFEFSSYRKLLIIMFLLGLRPRATIRSFF